MFGKLGLYAAAAFLGLSTVATAATLQPQVDFRSSTFSAANNQHSFYANVDGIGMTIQAYTVDDSGNQIEASLWWDSTDGLGIRGGENDEIDGSEYLTITFDNTIGLSHVFLSDLFVNENIGAGAFDESGLYEIDGQDQFLFDAAGLADTEGNKANGEHVIDLSKIIPVDSLTFRALSPGHDYSIIGFTDPPIPGASLQQVPVPPLLGFAMLLGILGLRVRRSI